MNASSSDAGSAVPFVTSILDNETRLSDEQVEALLARFKNDTSFLLSPHYGVVIEPIFSHKEWSTLLSRHHLNSSFKAGIWSFLAQCVYADLTHLYQFTLSEPVTVVPGLVSSLTKDRRTNDPNLLSYHPVKVVLSSGANQGFKYAKVLMGENNMSFANLYIMWLYYLHKRSCKEFALWMCTN
jgi:hypothetical protein